MKIMTINEWKESDNYIIGKWFNKLKLDIDDWFNDDMYKDLIFDDYTYDISGHKQFYIAILNFNENEKYQYKLEIIVEPEAINQEENIIEIINFKFYIYDSNSTELIGDIDIKDINVDELVPDMLLGLIVDIKKEFNLQ